jgi:DNA-binding HxlR family transcriptional regulator
MPIPKPGQPVRGSKTGAPIMALFDLLGRRWAMGIIWNLSQGALPFRALQNRCEAKNGPISPTLLNTRLKDLQEAKLVVRTLAGYQLTDLGGDVFKLIQPLGDWSLKWGKALVQDKTRK